MCLVAWVAAMPTLWPAAFAALGSLDRQHRVAMEARGAQTLVVLHHRSPARDAAHRHAALARVLTVFSESTDGTADHVIAFSSGGAWCADAPSLRLVAAPADVPPPAEMPVRCPVPSRVDTTARAPRPPPILAFALACLRSTTLRV
jgi:hypothetical protein